MRLMTILAVFSLMLFVLTASCTPPPPQQAGDGNGEAAVMDEGDEAAPPEEATEEPAEEMPGETEEGFTETDLPEDWVEEVKVPPGVHITDYSRTETSMHAAGYVEAPINRVFIFVDDLKNFLDWSQVRTEEWVREGSPRKAFYERPGMSLDITIVEEGENRTTMTMDLLIEEAE